MKFHPENSSLRANFSYSEQENQPRISRIDTNLNFPIRANLYFPVNTCPKTASQTDQSKTLVERTLTMWAETAPDTAKEGLFAVVLPADGP
jgi:hypothetical protein